MKLHRKIKHNEKVCRAHDLGSYAQGQGRNQVRGQNGVTLESFTSKFFYVIGKALSGELSCRDSITRIKTEPVLGKSS